MSVSEKVERWPFSESAKLDADVEMNEDKSDSDEEMTQLPHYYTESQSFILGSSAFHRLMTKIESQTRLTSRENTGAESLHREVLNAMKSQSFGHIRSGSPLKQAAFQIDWNLAQFFQHTDLSHEVFSIHEYPTLTGTPLEVQAATIASYMEQVWPITGAKTLNALQKALESQNLEKSGSTHCSVHCRHL